MEINKFEISKDDLNTLDMMIREVSFRQAAPIFDHMRKSFAPVVPSAHIQGVPDQQEEKKAN